MKNSKPTEPCANCGKNLMNLARYRAGAGIYCGTKCYQEASAGLIPRFARPPTGALFHPMRASK